jgi:hypothetical protein
MSDGKDPGHSRAAPVRAGCVGQRHMVFHLAVSGTEIAWLEAVA